MKVAVTGANGQLGQDVVIELTNKGHEVFAADRSILDITDETAVKNYIEKVKPEVILHCAAYTNVDKAEEDEDTAYQVNALGTKYLAQAASVVGSKMIYVSTDYVFDGTSTSPYEVDHPTSPLGVYGKTKLAGEQFIAENLYQHFIVRTSWVYGTKGNNFVKTMVRLGQERESIGVVHDQVGSPTYTVDLARFMLSLMETEKYGIYHASNTGVCSWYEFAVEIFNQSKIKVEVNPLTTEEFPRPAARPKYSVLSKSKITEEGFEQLPDWRIALTAYFQEAK